MAAIRARGSHSVEFWLDRISRYLAGQHHPQHALAARAAFAAVAGGEVVGFVAGHCTRRHNCDGELQWIDVVEERRRFGIAGRLMGRMGTWFVDEGLRRVCVNVAPDNSAALRLYARFGAAPLNEHWMIWEDAAAMTRSLGAPGSSQDQRPV